MPKRIDLDGGDPQDEIEQALRQLTQQRRRADPERELERAVQEVAEQQGQGPGKGRPAGAPAPWASKTAWIGLVCVVLGLLVASYLLMRREPPPPPATTAEQAVHSFYTYLIAGKYATATNYYPNLLTIYGSAAQAGAQLRTNLGTNPPTMIRSIGPAVPVEGSPSQFKVPFEVYNREGMPRNGEFVVQDTHTPRGFVIIEGGV